MSAPIGGQAVLEGVMMRGPSAWSVAVRKPDGEIAEVNRPISSFLLKHRWARLPVVRGVFALGESLAIGFRALAISANYAAQGEEGEEDLPAGDLRLHLAVLRVGILGGIVRRDCERAEADRERLAERDHAADDRQPEDLPLRHRRGDGAVDLGDLAVRLAYGHRPIRRRAHHHALEDGLPSDGHAQKRY